MTVDTRPAVGNPGYATSSPELERWLARHISEGFGAESLVLSMLRSGYDAAFARSAVATAMGHRRPDASATQPAPRLARREVPVLFSLQSPSIRLYQHLLSDAECDALVELARGRLARSPVINPDTGDENLIDARTSMGAMFQVGEHTLIQRIEDRIAAVLGVPVDHGEGLQILNYKPGGEYQPHFDFFNPKRPGEARQLRVGGQRTATLVIYLNTPQAGGATAFPRIGLEVAPVKGNAVYFSYLQPDGKLDERTLHAGLPVQSGEKWIATKWLREHPYRAGA
ncbi:MULTISPECIES: 2OG-Fe(II) oxygenase [Cupriavidus]|uniref:Procollagen-proline, 2-oxoglutarate-4-dioxygenase n=1 Tax=Cupriavidus pinatubonensis (strain JMP 134 / LMG 1197) TaxID=264198 RepID=Q46X23_CUPPJ|nr:MULTISPECIES: 2OG-Fe(II) oxygenase [Cupriavidus]QYY31162.1 2OG-Fe(II) oxygenase [Cupriavidus pinatubonensis]